MFDFPYQAFYATDPGITVTATLAGLSLLVFSFYTCYTIWLIYQKNPMWIILTAVAACSLVLAGIIFYIKSGIPMVLTDSLRGLLIGVFAFGYKYYLDKDTVTAAA
ncbi:MAG: hypothetical protein GY754_12130 [bacterium]|nr:hypothetical protein [bacterium]